MSRKLLMAAAAAASLSFAGVAVAQGQAGMGQMDHAHMGMAPAHVTAALADPGRPEADTKRDADRKPAEMLAFAGVQPGMTVVDFWPGGGYFTRIFSKAVGPKGTVYAVYPPPRPSTDPAKPTPTPAAETLAADAAYGNIKAVKETPAAFAIPTKADVVWTSQNYHDLHNVQGLDMAAFNKAVFNALKPGGVFIVLDHVGAAGDPEETHTVHRIDPAMVRKEVEAAGFKYEGESAVLRNAADDHSKNVFDPSLRGHTDQFVYKFRKPR